VLRLRLSSLQSFQNYAFEVSTVAIWRGRECEVAIKNALPIQRFCRNEHPNEDLLWHRLPMDLRRQRLMILMDTVSIVLNTQEGLGNSLSVIVFDAPHWARFHGIAYSYIPLLVSFFPY
jgi:hypothetical protein